MQDNEYTFRVLRAFRARFRHLNRNHAFPHEDVTQMLNRVVLSEDAVCKSFQLSLSFDICLI